MFYVRECRRCGRDFENTIKHFPGRYCPECQDKADSEIRNTAIDDFVTDFCNYIDEKYHHFADDERVEMLRFANKWKQEKQNGK